MGFPIADRKLTIADMEPLVGTVGHRTDPWQGRFMSSAKRFILTDSSMASLPTFVMGMFFLADGIHEDVEKHMSRFFSEGSGNK